MSILGNLIFLTLGFTLGVSYIMPQWRRTIDLLQETRDGWDETMKVLTLAVEKCRELDEKLKANAEVMPTEVAK